MSHGEVHRMWVSFLKNTIKIQIPTVGWQYAILLPSGVPQHSTYTPKTIPEKHLS